MSEACQVAGSVYVNGTFKAVIWREHAKCWGYSVWREEEWERIAFGTCINRAMARQKCLGMLNGKQMEQLS